jgi:hypothetical protein
MTIQEAVQTADAFCKRINVEMGDSKLLESLRILVAAARAHACEPCGVP